MGAKKRRMCFSFVLRYETEKMKADRLFTLGYEAGQMNERLEAKMNSLDPTGELRKQLGIAIRSLEIK